MNDNTFPPDKTGILEIDDNTHAVSKNYLVELKGVLDRYKIPYILDRVSFYSTEGSLALSKAIHNKKVWKVEKNGGVNLDNPFGHSAKFRYDHLIIENPELIKHLLENSDKLTSYERFLLKSIRDNHMVEK